MQTASSNQVRVLAVGQTPPPFGGQAIAIQKMIEHRYRQLRIFHVRMGFSRDMNEVGRFRFKKVLHLALLIPAILWKRFRYDTPILYYPPAGPNRIPLIRDLIILIATRWAFKKTVFHFHGGGLSSLYPRLSPFMRWLFRRAYVKPDLAIVLAEQSPPDGRVLQAKSVCVVPIGVLNRYPGRREPAPEPPSILFVGKVCESKGVSVLVEAAGRLRERGLLFRLKIIGQFESKKYEKTLKSLVTALGLADCAELPGVLPEEEKWRCYEESAVFCFPSFFDAENVSQAVVEAMQYELPCIVTQWRALPSLIDDGEEGFVVPIHSPEAVAEKLEWLLKNPEARRLMGRKGRDRFLRLYTLEKHLDQMESALLSVMEDVRR